MASGNEACAKNSTSHGHGDQGKAGTGIPPSEHDPSPSAGQNGAGNNLEIDNNELLSYSDNNKSAGGLNKHNNIAEHESIVHTLSPVQGIGAGRDREQEVQSDFIGEGGHGGNIDSADNEVNIYSYDNTHNYSKKHNNANVDSRIRDIEQDKDSKPEENSDFEQDSVNKLHEGGEETVIEQEVGNTPNTANKQKEQRDRLDAAFALASIINVATPPTTPVPVCNVSNQSPPISLSSDQKDQENVMNTPGIHKLELSTGQVFAYVPNQVSHAQPTFAKAKKSPKTVTDTSHESTVKEPKKKATKPRRKKKSETKTGLPPAICLPKGSLLLNHNVAHANTESITPVEGENVPLGSQPRPLQPPPPLNIKLTQPTGNTPTTVSTASHQHFILSHMMKSPSFVQHYHNMLMLQNASVQQQQLQQLAAAATSTSEVQPIVVSPVSSLETCKQAPPLLPLDLTKEQDEPLDLKVRRFPCSSSSAAASPPLQPDKLHFGNPQVPSGSNKPSTPVPECPSLRSLRTATNVGLLESSGAPNPTIPLVRASDSTPCEQNVFTEDTPMALTIQSPSSSFVESPNISGNNNHVKQVKGIIVRNQEVVATCASEPTYDKKLPPKKRRIYGSNNADASPIPKQRITVLKADILSPGYHASRTLSEHAQLTSGIVKVASLDSSMRVVSKVKVARTLQRSLSQGGEPGSGEDRARMVVPQVSSLPVMVNSGECASCTNRSKDHRLYSALFHWYIYACKNFF